MLVRDGMKPQPHLVSSDIDQRKAVGPFEMSNNPNHNNSYIVPLRNRNSSKIIKDKISGTRGKSSIAPMRQSYDQLTRKISNLRA